jgi:hypothetical protein
MMTDREKLVELINEGVEIYTDGWQKQFGAAEAVADHMIANGVTVQEWISVKDDKPKPFISVLVYMPDELPFPTVREGYVSSDGTWVAGGFKREPGEVVKWKPMVEPPKEE